MDWTHVFDMHSHLGYLRGREYTVWEALRRMDRNHIARAVICHFVTGLFTREDFVRANDYVLGAVRAAPDRFVGLCTMTPAFGAWAVEEFRRYLSAGLSGLKLHPERHGLYSLTSAAMEPLMREVESASAFVFVHSDFHSKVCSPYDVVEMAAMFPGAKVLLGHFGLDPDLCGKIPALVAGTPNVYLDTSQTVDCPEAIFVQPARVLGIGRVLFGSDAPVMSPEVNLRKLEVAVEEFGLPVTDAQAIAWESAAALLKGAPNVRM